ncbi:DUF5686 and carboxypeptidase-like regulatory domain-containing protein [Dysgonomonas sp. ZJ279]|uniref:DUF5686 and carboxypeptidase-like regulatory domain-containing protein n=1 Tax=Dysgonomonas sp. ZJ279 TaxID=2709796 RepID=UPI0013EC4DB4|nr:DUF5686 and carboxypeptidase-like regulatory domain-containing protein [Dysgonomonas sp. ZJ279]
MNKTLLYNIINKKAGIFLIFFFTSCTYTLAQNVTSIRGIIKDSLTLETLPFVTIQFENTTNGVFSDNDGEFKLSNRNNNTVVVASFIGYKTKKFTIPAGKATVQDIFLEPEDLALQEVIVRPKKEKYSKKDNPAVELIKKVIAHKHDNNITSEEYYQYNEYERIFFALNDFKPEQSQFKRYKFLPNYIDTSIIDNKPILPFSLREKTSENHYRKEPKTNKKIVKGYHIEGIDKVIDTEGIDAIIAETFKDVSIYDNSITLLYHSFISPLSEHSSVNFYKWYLNDTVYIDGQKVINLSFAPFNSRDIGFTGTLYITADSTYAVKRAILRTPKKMNINFVEELVIEHDFIQTESGKWVPHEQRMAMDLSMLDAVKFYVDKTQTLSDFEFGVAPDSVYNLEAPVSFEKDYLKRPKEFWSENRPENHQKDYRMDMMMDDMNKVFLFRVLLNAGNIISTGYVQTSKVPELNKIEIGTVPTLYSYNPVEGNRFRLTATTTKYFHPNLFLYGYGAYGTRDGRFKYYGEATWAFNEVEKHKNEYPQNNLTVAYKYDMNNLGQRFLQAERDNILMSIRPSRNEKLTYNRQMQVSYNREYHNGFSFNLSTQLSDESPAGNLLFEKIDELGNKYSVSNIQITETSLALRYAPNEKFFQQRRKRFAIPSEKFVINLSHAIALKDVLGGQYDYNKTSFSILKEKWVSPFGKLTFSAQAEKIWGEIPFPLLITPSANNSYTIQKGSFYMINPLEFVHDSQVTWEVYYHMGGWLFNRIPFIKVLKWREVAGFRGFYGELSKRNNPTYNHDLLILPQTTYTTSNTPYMEYNVGIENIFKFFRIDYVRRLNYLDHPDISKDGFRISFDMTF